MSSFKKATTIITAAFMLTIAGLTILAVGPNQSIAQEMAKLKYGPFKGAKEGIWGEGSASVTMSSDGSYKLQLSEDFSVRPGPDLEVVLVKAPNINGAEDLMASEYISIAQLEKSDGSQTYQLPDGLDPSQFGSVVIYCEEYTVLFSSASLAK